MYLYFLNYPWQNSSVISAHWLQLPKGEDSLGAWETSKGSSSTVTCSTKGWKTIWVSFKLKLKAADPNFSNPLILKAETTQWRHWGDLNSSQSSWEVEELWSWWAGALQQAEILECPAGKHNASTAQAFGGLRMTPPLDYSECQSEFTQQSSGSSSQSKKSQCICPSRGDEVLQPLTPTQRTDESPRLSVISCCLFDNWQIFKGNKLFLQ